MFSFSCAQPQADACLHYDDCLSYYREIFEIPLDASEDFAQSFGEGGVCWLDTENAKECEQRCLDGRKALKRALLIANADLGICKDLSN